MKSFSFAGLSLFLVSPAKIRNGGSDVDAARELGIFLDEESVINLEDDGEINILSAVATYSAQSKQKPRVLWVFFIGIFESDAT